jgi:hypothetical protein
MGESQSRYSIVERLTNKKLSLLDEESKLDREIEYKIQSLAAKRNDFISWEQEAKEDMERESRGKYQDIASTEAEIKFLKESKENKKETIKTKLVEIDDALIRLEAISRVANE